MILSWVSHSVNYEAEDTLGDGYARSGRGEEPLEGFERNNAEANSVD
jgi:hypothetical protein